MGNSNSTSRNYEHNIKSSDYTVARKFQDFLLGEFFEVTHNNSGKILLMKTRTISDVTQYQESIESSTKRILLTHPNLVKVHGFVGKESKGTLSTYYKIHVYFDPLPKDLAKTLKNRKSPVQLTTNPTTANKYLSESELFSIMDQLVNVLEYLQTQNVSHGDIRPEACWMTEDGKVMLCDRKLIYEEELKMGDDSEVNLLLSPAIFNARNKGQKKPKDNKYKSDVWSLGLTLLECATLRRSAQIYEWTSLPTINYNTLLTRLSEVQKRYSQKISQIMGEMLKVDEEQRPDFIKLKKWVTGAEPMKKRTPSYSKTTNDDVQQGGPLINRATIGPKLMGPQKLQENEFIASQRDHGKIGRKHLGKEDEPKEESPKQNSYQSPKFIKKSFLGRDDEDEVVEFETEETPKRGVYLDQNQLYNSGISLNPNQSPWNAYSSRYPERESFGVPSQIAASRHPTDFSSPVPEFKENNWRLVSKNSYDLQNSGVFSLGGASGVSTARDYNHNKLNFDYPSIETNLKKHHSEKASTFDGNHTPSTGAYTEFGDPILSKFNSSGVKTDFAISGVNSPKVTRNKTEPLFSSQYKDNGISSTLKPIEEKGSMSQLDYSTYSNPAVYSSISSPLQIGSMNNISSPLKTEKEMKFYVSDSSLLDKGPQLDSSIHYEASRGTEPYRSLVLDEFSYSLLSLNPKKSENLISQVHSQTFHSYSSNKGDDDNVSHSSFTMIGDKGDVNTPMFRNYESPSFSGPGSRNSLDLSGTHTPERGISYSNPITSRNLDMDNSPLTRLKDLESEDLFKKALERTKDTYHMLRAKGSHQSSYSEDPRKVK